MKSTASPVATTAKSKAGSSAKKEQLKTEPVDSPRKAHQHAVLVGMLLRSSDFHPGERSSDRMRLAHGRVKEMTPEERLELSQMPEPERPATGCSKCRWCNMGCSACRGSVNVE